MAVQQASYCKLVLHVVTWLEAGNAGKYVSFPIAL